MSNDDEDVNGGWVVVPGLNAITTKMHQADEVFRWRKSSTFHTNEFHYANATLLSYPSSSCWSARPQSSSRRPLVVPSTSSLPHHPHCVVSFEQFVQIDNNTLTATAGCCRHFIATPIHMHAFERMYAHISEIIKEMNKKRWQGIERKEN